MKFAPEFVIRRRYRETISRSGWSGDGIAEEHFAFFSYTSLRARPRKGGILESAVVYAGSLCLISCVRLNAVRGSEVYDQTSNSVSKQGFWK